MHIDMISEPIDPQNGIIQALKLQLKGFNELKLKLNLSQVYYCTWPWKKSENSFIWVVFFSLVFQKWISLKR